MSQEGRFSWLRRILGREKATAAPLACRELVELVTNYLDGALTPGEHARVESHLADCPHCTRYVEQMRLTIRATGELREADIRPEAREALLAAFRDWKSG
ncbi:MAG: zf-HC2 domain-containing protein [bacterium]